MKRVDDDLGCTGEGYVTPTEQLALAKNTAPERKSESRKRDRDYDEPNPESLKRATISPLVLGGKEEGDLVSELTGMPPLINCLKCISAPPLRISIGERLALPSPSPSPSASSSIEGLVGASARPSPSSSPAALGGAAAKSDSPREATFVSPEEFRKLGRRLVHVTSKRATKAGGLGR